MCLIIRTQKNLPVSKTLLDHFIERNDDGWGMMWRESNQLKTFKSLNMDDCYAFYIDKLAFEPIIHLRWRTHGNKDTFNCHPYYCGYGIWMMHNGTISMREVDKTKSDTWHFIEHYLKPLFAHVENPHKFLRSSAFQAACEAKIGSSNRLIFGDRGGYVAVNSHSWHTIKNEKTAAVGLVVSNTYAWDEQNYDKPKEPVKPYSPTPITTIYPTGVSGRKRKDATAGKHVVTTTSLINAHSGITAQTSMFNNSPLNWGDDEDEGMTHVTGNLFHDDLGLVFAFMPSQNVYRRMPLCDKIYGVGSPWWRQKYGGGRLLTGIQATGTAWVPPPTIPKSEVPEIPPLRDTTTVTTTDPNDIQVAECTIVIPTQGYSEITDDEYVKDLVRNYESKSEYELSSFVYTEPDDAVKVLHFLLKAA